MKIYSFIFPIGEFTQFRTKMCFSSMSDAQTWAAEQLLVKSHEYCLLKEVPSSDHVFNPVEEAHYAVRWTADMPYFDTLFID